MRQFRNEVRWTEVAHRERATRRWSRSAALAACLGAAVTAAACDERFDPIAPSDLAFSVFGYLDASADTQWIRITPIRRLSTTSPDRLAATVTLEHLATGRIIPLRDSVFAFPDPSGEIGTSYVHNFWTTEPIEPGGAYRFSAQREGRPAAEAVVEIPHDYAVAVAIRQPHQGQDDELRITGVKHLPFLTQDAEYFDACGSHLRRFQWEGRSAEDETYLIPIRKQEVPFRAGCGSPRVESRYLRIVASEAAWPGGGYSPAAMGDVGLTSNVSHAVGFLGGVLTKRIPYEDCMFESAGAPIPPVCELRYGPTTATVAGIVRDAVHTCVGPLDSVTVQLTELGPDPARVRTVVTTRAGAFAIAALQPGIPHRVWARAPPVPIDSEWVAATFQWKYTEWFDVHAIHTDTVTLAPGARLGYDLPLERWLPCNQGTLLGTVTEARCGDGPIDSATVQLTEQGVPPPLIPRTLTGYTDHDGRYLITGLRQYVHYLQVQGSDPPRYTERIDYLRFFPDQVVKYDVELGRLTPCGEPPPGGR